MATSTASGREPHSDFAVMTKGLTKAYGTRMAVSGIDLAIPRGSLSGFVGPNGAGKTTTIRMLLDLIRPTAGAGWVLDKPLNRPSEFLPKVGALVENPAFYPALSGRENLRVLSRLGNIADDRIEPLLEMVGLGERGDDHFRSYSLGMKQRLGIAAALLPDPELFILDEPTNGLDPAGIAEMRVLLQTIAKDGRTVLVSSHLLSEVEQMCTHLVVIRSGKLVFQGQVSDLLDAQNVEVTARPEDPADLMALGILADQLGKRATVVNGQVTIAASDDDFSGQFNRAAMERGITLVHLSADRPRLEEAFLALTDGDNESATSSSHNG
ncbi:MAG: ABC transporter ATP-binding protein [Acidimicrobiales bacterium]